MAATSLSSLLMPSDPQGGSLGSPATMHPPLTAIAKTAIVSYLLVHGYTTAEVEAYVRGNGPPRLLSFVFAKYIARNSNADDAKNYDPALLQAYGAVYAGGGFGHTNPTTQSPDLNPWDWVKGVFTNGALWTRVAEFAVGGILIAVGTGAIVKKGLR